MTGSILEERPLFLPCGISRTALGQKAHSRLTTTAKNPPAQSSVVLNLLLLSRLRARCNSQQFLGETATFVHRLRSEAV